MSAPTVKESSNGSLLEIVVEEASRIRQSEDAPLPGPLLVTVTLAVAALPAFPLAGLTLMLEITKSGNWLTVVTV